MREAQPALENYYRVHVLLLRRDAPRELLRRDWALPRR